jgi:hypothetical protein
MPPKLAAAQLQPAEHARMVWVARPAAGTPFETLLEPAYWAHVAKSLQPGHEIVVRPPEGHYYARLLVRDAGALWAKVAVLQKHEFATAAIETATAAGPETDAFEIRQVGSLGYCVVRLADKQRVYEGGKTKADAARWLQEHLAAVAG